MAAFKGIVVDSLHPAKLARFWAVALDGYAVRAYDDTEIARLAALGITPETDPSVMVDGPGPTLCFHIKAGRAAVRGRLHLDTTTEDRAAETKRLMALGATERDVRDNYTVMLDPEGNAFCMFDP